MPAPKINTNASVIMSDGWSIALSIPHTRLDFSPKTRYNYGHHGGAGGPFGLAPAPPSPPLRAAESWRLWCNG